MVRTPSTRPASSETNPVCLERRRVSLPAAPPANQGKRGCEGGWQKFLSSVPCRRKMKDQTVAYDPDVPRDEERLRVGGEERHPLPRALLLLVLCVYPPRPVFAGLGHAAERLRVMYEGLVESPGQRCIRNVCRENAQHSAWSGNEPEMKVASCLMYDCAYRHAWGLSPRS